MKNDFEQQTLLRIIDANRNRCAEGLRVVEDFARFALNDAHLSRRCKEIRHAIDVHLKSIPLPMLTASRDTNRDVGTQIETAHEYQRDSLQTIAVANLQRAKQATRAIEEFVKPLDTSLAKEIEQIRYRIYSVEKSIVLTVDSLQRLSRAYLYVLLGGGSSLSDFENSAKPLVDAGVHIIQLRDKQLSDRELLSRGRLLREMTAAKGTRFIFNDRADLARLTDADGVHVGQDELSVFEARKIIGPNKLVGVSTHSLAEAKQAVEDGANYIGVGPTFPSQTKSFQKFTGIELLRQVSQEISLPTFAIGGISLDNLSNVTDSGISRVAVGNSITHSTDVASAVSQFLKQLQ